MAHLSSTSIGYTSSKFLSLSRYCCGCSTQAAMWRSGTPANFDQVFLRCYSMHYDFFAWEDELGKKTSHNVHLGKNASEIVQEGRKHNIDANVMDALPAIGEKLESVHVSCMKMNEIDRSLNQLKNHDVCSCTLYGVGDG